MVVGGAPVLLFPWAVSDATASHLLPWLSVDVLPAWRGLGLASERLGLAPEARRAYERYLEIAPDARDADTVRERLARLSP